MNNDGFTYVESRTINGTNVEVYFDGDAYYNGQQIGEALGYANPKEAIEKIHSRHKDRLDKLSTVIKLSTADGKERDVVVYRLRGVFEICRWSTRPEADEVMNALFEIGQKKGVTLFGE